MRKLSSIFSVGAILVASSIASAQPAKEAKPEGAKPATEAPKAPEGPPKAPAEMQQYKDMIGNWKCTGKMSAGGKEVQTTGTYKAAYAHDGFWVVAQFAGTAKGMPGKQTGTDIYGYDAASKQYVMYSIDNMGGSSSATSKGWEGDTMNWAGKGQMMGQQADMKQSVTKKSPKEVQVSGSAGAGMTWEATCKK